MESQPNSFSQINSRIEAMCAKIQAQEADNRALFKKLSEFLSQDPLERLSEAELLSLAFGLEIEDGLAAKATQILIKRRSQVAA